MPGFSGCTHLGANGANAAPQLLQEEGRTPACRFGEKGFLESPLPSAGTLPQQFTKGFAMPDQTVRLFGIRHHGPGCARSLLRALEAMQPDCLLIEGPPDGESVLPFVLESGMCPPVALLVYAPDDSRRAVFYPFAEFSPEWWRCFQVPARLKRGPTGLAVRLGPIPSGALHGSAHRPSIRAGQGL